MSECGALRCAFAIIKRLASDWIGREATAETLRFARRTLALESQQTLRCAFAIIKRLASEWIGREATAETLRFARRTLAQTGRLARFLHVSLFAGGPP